MHNIKFIILIILIIPLGDEIHSLCYAPLPASISRTIFLLKTYALLIKQFCILPFPVWSMSVFLLN